jgi:cell division protein YceG involved in septum cleavage
LKRTSFIFRLAIGIAVFALALTLAGRTTTASAASLSQANNPHLMKINHGSNVRTAGTDLVYQGGAVETTPVVYISWWGSQWNTGFSTGGYSSSQAQTYIEGFFSNVGGSSWADITTQ